MKLKYLLIIVLFAVFACKEVGNKELVGSWEITKFVVIQTNQKTAVSTEQELIDKGAVWDIRIKNNGNFRQDFNMRNPSKKMEVESGTWTSGNDTLYILLQKEKMEQPIPLRYTYKFDEEEQLVLTITSPNNTGQVVSTFRKK